jgi:hypothetical protein
MIKLDAHGLRDIDFSKMQLKYTLIIVLGYSQTIVLSCPLIVFTFSLGFSSLKDSVNGRNVSAALGTVLFNAKVMVTGILSSEKM